MLLTSSARNCENDLNSGLKLKSTSVDALLSRRAAAALAAESPDEDDDAVVADDQVDVRLNS